ncbi:MAG TPA: glycosyltransferase, partial [Mycobacterium sp.]|nr:glycosyltransferase [Mycobacterium sp.]
MQVLLITHPSFSHAAQLIELARALEQNGHRVRMAAPPRFAASLGRHGLDAHPVGRDWELRRGDPVFDVTVGQRDIFGFAHVPDRAGIDGLAALAERTKPDLIVREYTEFAGWAVARKLGIPFATQGFVHRLPGPVEQALADASGRVAELADIEPAIDMDDLIGAVYLDPVPPGFRAPWEHDGMPRVLVRPSIFDGAGSTPAPDWLARLGRSRPLVYITFGTVYMDVPRLWDTVFAAVANLDADCVVTTGRMDPAALPSAPANVRSERYIPQSHVLARATAIVCHAGFNTLIGAFAAGVPALCLPMDADQPLNATCCAAAGAGVNGANAPARDPRGPRVDPETLTPDAIAESITQLITVPTYRQRAAVLANQIASMPARGDHP